MVSPERIVFSPSITLLQAPPCGIPGYSLLSGGRLFAGDRSCALVRVPPAQHCIFCFSTFRCRFTPVPQGTPAGYPRRFSPMRTFQQLPLLKADASQNGFHPAYALSCRMAWRNSLSYEVYKDHRLSFSPSSGVSPSTGILYHAPLHGSRKKRCECPLMSGFIFPCGTIGFSLY